MSKGDFFASMFAGIFIAILAIFWGITPFAQPAHAQSEVDQIRLRMLGSHDNWTSLNGEAITTWFSNGQQQTTKSTFVLVEDNQAAFSTANATWIADGTNIFEINHDQSTYTVWNQPKAEGVLGSLPSSLGSGQEIYRHPMALLAMSPIADYIFPTGLAQRNGEYTLLGEEEIIGRKVWKVEYKLSNDQGQLTMHALYWVDQELALILRSEVFNTDEALTNDLYETTEFVSLEINSSSPDDAFVPNIEGYREVQAE